VSREKANTPSNARQPAPARRRYKCRPVRVGVIESEIAALVGIETPISRARCADTVSAVYGRVCLLYGWLNGRVGPQPETQWIAMPVASASLAFSVDLR